MEEDFSEIFLFTSSTASNRTNNICTPFKMCMALVDEKRCGLSELRNTGFGTVHALTSVEEKMVSGDRRDDSSSGS
jgi:hypothetical protein